MSPLANVPSEFAAESVAAFAQANADRIRAVRGGVVRADGVSGKVVIIMGGGSGHHPAFAGWVGRGLIDAAVCGNVFASPSEHQVLEVARAADQGAGILFLPINYAGDILHFTAARDALRADGVDARMVVIADDIASGSPEERTSRRGIAGSLVVAKIVGAAAEAGYGIDALELLARRAEEATRTFGVAFSGCVLPGSAEPLFSLPDGIMSVGMGIHGEPGIAQREIGSAAGVADALVDGLLAERPAESGQRVAVIVNGLGATKYDELNLVFARVADRLRGVGLVLVAPLVGEFMTSLDMAAVSVSIAVLDDELERHWGASVDSVALSRAQADFIATSSRYTSADAPDGAPIVRAASSGSRLAARRVRDALARALSALEDEASELGRLDAVAGDGDHGMGMVAGASAAREAAEELVDRGAGAGTLLRASGDRWSAVAGGTSGALWGTGLAAAGTTLGDEALATQDLASAVAAFAAAVLERGGAELGDKTMVDAVVPFERTLAERLDAGDGFETAWRTAATVAMEAAEATANLLPRRGRARIHGDKALGTPDPGAVSFALVVGSVLP